MTSQSPQRDDNFLAFYQEVGRSYPEEPLVYSKLRGRVRKAFVLRHLQSFSGRFLDLGCNRGTYLEHYQGEKVGVDISLPVLKHSRHRTNAFLVQGDAQDLGFIRSSTIDSILCSEMLEHVLRPDKVLTECYRILRPGGQILITTPNYQGKKPTWVGVGEMADYGVHGFAGDTYFHTAFRPEELAELASAAGFSDVATGTLEREVKYATRLPVVFCHSINFLNRRWLRSVTIERMSRAFLDASSLMIYRICSGLGLNNLLVGLVSEGVRSYMVAQK